MMNRNYKNISKFINSLKGYTYYVDGSPLKLMPDWGWNIYLSAEDENIFKCSSVTCMNAEVLVTIEIEPSLLKEINEYGHEQIENLIAKDYVLKTNTVYIYEKGVGNDVLEKI